MQDQNQEENDQEINEMLENFEQSGEEEEENPETGTEVTEPDPYRSIVIDGDEYSVDKEVADRFHHLQEEVERLQDEVQAKQRTINKLNDRLSNLGPQSRIGNR